MEELIGASGNIKVTQDERGNYIIDIDPTFGGQVSINTVGTIVQGNWRGDPVDPQYGGTGTTNPQEATLHLGGKTTITGPLIINCDNTLEDLKLTVVKSGNIAIIEESLQIAEGFSELSQNNELRQKAFDNIAPTKNTGDIVYFNGTNNVGLRIGTFSQFLGVDQDLPTWKDLPMCYKSIKQGNFWHPSRSCIKFDHVGFNVCDNFKDECTVVQLSGNLKELAEHRVNGVMAYINGLIKSFILHGENGVKLIEVPSEVPEEPNILHISIDENYKGQESIDTVGNITTGAWNADIVGPEFGGTGCKNQNCILLGGDLVTEMNVMFFEGDEPTYQKSDYIKLNVQGTTTITLPLSGMVATEENSLQCRHNLGDVRNSIEAFSNISPTQRRGDLIVKGYGDYDIPVHIGQNGEVLTVNKSLPGYVEWKSLDLENTIRSTVEDILEEKTKATPPPTTVKPNCFGDTISLEEALHSICTSLDYTVRLGQLKPTKELKTMLDKWNKYNKTK